MNNETKNIFKLKTHLFEGEYDEYAISTNLYMEDFEKLIIKLNKEALEKDLVSSGSILSYIVEELEKQGHKQVLVYDRPYLLEDRCPIPNSTYWVEKKISYENLDKEMISDD